MQEYEDRGPATIAAFYIAGVLLLGPVLFRTFGVFFCVLILTAWWVLGWTKNEADRRLFWAGKETEGTVEKGRWAWVPFPCEARRPRRSSADRRPLGVEEAMAYTGAGVLALTLAILLFFGIRK